MTLCRRKILFLIPSLAGGGAERVFSLLLAHLDRSRFELHLGLLQAEGPFLPEVPPDVTIHKLHVSRVRYALPALLKLVWRLKPHTVLSTLSHLNLALAICKFLMPRSTRLILRQAWSVNGNMELIKNPNRWNWAYRRFYGNADLIVCQSDYMMEELRRHSCLSPTKLVRIYNPVDLRRVWESAQSGERPYPGSGLNIVTAGRLSWEKGYDVLLDAMPEVIRALPSVQVYILGDGPRHEELLEQSHRLALGEVVHFVGFQKNPWPYFWHADLFVLPSRDDALPNALLEALALGKAVVATDCPGGIREILDCDSTIVLVPPGNAGELAKAIIAACQSPRKAGAGVAETRLRMHKFDLQQLMEDYVKILSG